MYRQSTLSLAAVLAFFLTMNCTGCRSHSYTAGLEEFTIEEKGMIICSPPTGHQEVDLDAGITRSVFDGKSFFTENHWQYRTGWRRDVIWRISYPGSSDSLCSLDVVSPYSGTVERCGLVGEKDRWFREVYGSISDDLVLVRLRTRKEAGTELHVCFFNTFTGEVEKFWKSADLAAEPLSISPYGDIVTLAVRPKNQPEEKTLNQAVWVYDCRQKKLTNLTENLKLPPDVLKNIDFKAAQVSPATGIVLLPEGESYYEALWAHNPQTRETHKIVTHGAYLQRSYIFAPDGKRAILSRFLVYDVSTQIIAEVPKKSSGATSTACWSPSGRYIAYHGMSGRGFSGCYGWDLRVCEVTVGHAMKVSDYAEMDRQINWLAPLVSRKEANINYAKWLISLLERNVETDKAVKRLQEITGQNIGPAHADWQKWLAENEQFLSWSEEDQKFALVEDAKNADIPLEVWEIIPSEKRAEWGSLNDTERDSLRTNAEKGLNARRNIEKAAWRMGVAPKVWVLIPENKQADWPDLKAEERIKLVAEGKKKWLKEADKPATGE